VKKKQSSKSVTVKATTEGGVRLHIAVEITPAELRTWDAGRIATLFHGLARVVASRSGEEILWGLEAERDREDRLMRQLQEVQRGLDRQEARHEARQAKKPRGGEGG
jgi:hypothetical protein